MTMNPHRARIYLGLGIVFSLLWAADRAEARTETLEWEYSNPAAIAGFEVLYGTQSQTYTEQIDVGGVVPTNGFYTYVLTVPDDATVYVAVRAYDSAGNKSGPSNERVRSATTQASAPPVEPTPPAPPPTGALAPFQPAGDLAIDFESVPLGTSVSGWIDTQANSVQGVDDSLFEVAEINGNSVLRTRSTATNIHSHYVADGSDGWSGYEFRGAMLITNSSGGIGVTAHSQFPDQDVYYRLRRYSNLSFELSPHVSNFSCSNSDTGVVPQAGAWYRFSLRVDPTSTSNRVTAKVWRDGSPEPSSPQADCTDTSPDRPRSGTIGVWAMGPGEKHWDVLDVSGVSVSSTPPSPPTPPTPPVLIQVTPAP